VAQCPVNELDTLMIPTLADPAARTAGREHILTVVIEDYFQVGSFSDLIPSAHWERFESRLRKGTGAILQLLADTGNRATFFSCGWIADHHPEVLREVAAAGHEIAAQGYYQHSVLDISPAAFGEDLRRSRDAIEQVTGCAVHGHRIGRRWLRSRDLWVLEHIAQAGFEYDSSVCPYGREYAAFPECETVHRRRVAGKELFEVPISSQRLAGMHVPIIGGNWFRQLPEWPLRRAATRWVDTRAAPMVAYLHTWEFDADQPRIAGADALQRLRHYRNLAPLPARVRRWLTAYRFGSVAAHLQLGRRTVDAARGVPPRVPASPAWPRQTPGAQARPPAPLTLVIPCYNELQALPYLNRTLRRFGAQRGAGLALSYVFVDDGSSDQSWPLMRSLFADLPRCTLLRHPVNRGIAAALLTGFAATATDLVAVLDADCTFDPDQLPAMLDLMTERVDVVSASPAHASGAMKNVPRWRAAMSRGAAALYRRVLHHRLTSYTSCFRIYRRSVVNGLTLSDPGFCGVAEILGRLDLAGCHIVEFPAVLETRVLGVSKIRVLRTMIDHLRLLARLAAFRWLGRPLPARVAAMQER